MLASIQRVLLQECGLDPSRPILVGFSGGPDSYCLLDILDRLGYPVLAAHLDHGLRERSPEDAQKVAQIARARGINVVLWREDVAGFSAERGWTLEEAARELRYRFLFDQASQQKAQAVAVAHTADDQVETVLMHLLRGAGLAGLKGMLPRTSMPEWSATIPLVRPLLSIWRAQVLEYCHDRGLEPLFDESNLDTRLHRNRMRHEIIPYLETFNPRLRQGVWRLSRVLAGDLEVIQGVIESAWNACVESVGSGYIRIRRDVLQEFLPGVKRGVLRRGIVQLQPSRRDVDFNTIERALEFLEQPSPSRQCNLVAGLYLVSEEDWVFLADLGAELPRGEWPHLENGKRCELDAPGDLPLGGGWLLRVELGEDDRLLRESARGHQDPYQAWADADTVNFPLCVRGRQPGDRFQPFGLGGHSLKLSDLMINLKIPRRARANWPLVCSADEIIWVPGYRLAQPYRVTDDTSRILYLRVHRPLKGE